MSNKNKTVKTVSYIMIITLLGKVLALIRDMLLARFYGSGMDTSAFLTASRIPRVLFDAIFASAKIKKLPKNWHYVPYSKLTKNNCKDFDIIHRAMQKLGYVSDFLI